MQTTPTVGVSPSATCASPAQCRGDSQALSHGGLIVLACLCGILLLMAIHRKGRS
jgi:hypothetical protein